MSSVGSTAASGALGGAVTGGTVGLNPALMAATGGLSAPIGAAAGGLIGGVSGFMKGKAKDDANKAPDSDPRELLALYNARQREKAIASGTDVQTQYGVDQAKKLQASAGANILRASGGNTGGTINALLRSQKATQNNVNQTVAAGESRRQYFANLGNQLTQKVANRKLQMQLMRQSQANADQAQFVQNQNANISGAIGTMGGNALKGINPNGIDLGANTASAAGSSFQNGWNGAFMDQSYAPIGAE